nr:hypothetical protein [Tanacetum cinerariifolium]
MEGLTPSMIDMTVEKEKLSSLEDTTVLGSFPPLPTQVTTSAGNAPGNSSYANVTSKPSRKKVNVHTLFIPRGNGIDVVVSVDSIHAIIWVKLYGVTVTDINEDGLSAIATKLGTPLKLDSYTSDMCMQLGKEYRPVTKKPNASSSGNKKNGVVPIVEVSNSNPFDALNSVDNDGEFSTDG